ncbi:MAG: galactose oxidase [Cyclobacteriaceae bacterium]
MKNFLILVFAVLLATPVFSQWRTIRTRNQCSARHECGFVEHKKDLYLVGGRRIHPVEKFTVADSAWAQLAETPLEMHHITPVSVNDKIYVVGGLTGKYPKEPPLSHVYAFDPKTNTWVKVFEIPEDRRRGGAGVTVYKGQIYIVNGITLGHTSGTCAMFDVYDPEANTWTKLPDAPTIRDHSSAVVLGGKLIALGGRNTSYHEEGKFSAFFSTVRTTVDYFDFKTQKWDTYKSEVPAPSAGAGAVAFKGKVYFVGGETGEKPANHHMYAFNPKKDEWVKKSYLNRGRHGTNAVLRSGKIYIAAGSGNRGGGPELTSIEVYTE